MKKKPISDYTDSELVQMANDNHIWLNAFACINPTQGFLADVGRMILEKLESTDMADQWGISPKIILTVNKS